MVSTENAQNLFRENLISFCVISVFYVFMWQVHLFAHVSLFFDAFIKMYIFIYLHTNDRATKCKKKALKKKQNIRTVRWMGELQKRLHKFHNFTSQPNASVCCFFQRHHSSTYLIHHLATQFTISTWEKEEKETHLFEIMH